MAFRKVDFDLNDLNRSALERLVRQLLTANDNEEKAIMKKLSARAKKNDLADLDEEMHGKPNTPMVEDDDPFDLEVGGGDAQDSDAGDSETDMQPKKKRGKK